MIERHCEQSAAILKNVYSKLHFDSAQCDEAGKRCYPDRVQKTLSGLAAASRAVYTYTNVRLSEVEAPFYINPIVKFLNKHIININVIAKEEARRLRKSSLAHYLIGHIKNVYSELHFDSAQCNSSFHNECLLKDRSHAHYPDRVQKTLSGLADASRTACTYTNVKLSGIVVELSVMIKRHCERSAAIWFIRKAQSTKTLT